MKVSDLKANEKNPRKISSQSQKELHKALAEFGDLSGIIFNIKTKRLVGGHQRSKLLPPDATIKKKKLKEPSATGTVAEGYIEFNGEQFKYREVDWDKKKETAAMIAANQHGGEWDKDILKLNFADLGDVDLELTGFSADELKLDFDIEIEIPEISLEEPKAESDEQYVANTPQSTEQIPTENPNENVKVDKKDFDEVKDHAQVVNKRFVIVIDCPDQDTKDHLKEKLRPELDEAKCKIF